MEAIILAGGKGERLRPYTEDRPKPMVPVLGIPILAFQVGWLKGQGVERIVMSCGYRHDVIKEYFGNGEKLGLEIRYSVEDEPLGRGGAIKQAFRETEGTHPFVIATNGDIVTNLNLHEMIAYHREREAMATVMLTPLVSPYGIADVSDDGHVLSFREKPELPYWLSAGVYVLQREVYELLPDQGDHEDSTFPELARQRRLYAHRSRDFWRAVDTAKDLSELSKEMERRLLTSFLNAE